MKCSIYLLQSAKNNHQFYQQKHAERKQRWGIRKLSVGVASVLLGTTFMLYSNHAVLADTVTNPSDVTSAQEGNKGTVSEGTSSTSQTSGDSTAPDEGQGKALTETPTGPQANGQKVNQQVPNDTDDQAKKVTVTDEKTDAVANSTPATPTTSEAPTSLPMSNQDIKLDSQPMLTEIRNKPKDNWVYKNMKWYPEYSTAKVKEILQNHTTNDDSGRYYFAGAANYNESYHVVYLLARSNNLDDNKLYVTILHTGTGNIQEEVVAPGESKKVDYNGTGGTTHAPIFTNYDGTSVSIDLDGVEKGDNVYGMVVGFAYGHNTGIYGEPASMGNGFMMTPMPTKVTTTIHYVDQATGDELAVPKSFEGVAYQKYTITGEAPTIDGYTLKKSPNTTGYISPYKVGESYDFRLDKHVVVKQTVIDSQGLVRVTAYYDGEEINNTTRYLGNIPNVNDHYSFFAPHGKSYTYINQITSTNDGIVYYYAKDGSEDKSEVRIHYIDVTGNKNSLFVPGDGKEVATDKISGKLGENYNYNVNLPTDYNLATNQANTVNGTYTIDHHDEYVYVVKKTSAEKLDPTVPAKTKVDDPKKLTADEKKEVEANIRDHNSGLPQGTQIAVGDNGDTTITYPDHSVDTIPGTKLVEEKTDTPTPTEKTVNVVFKGVDKKYDGKPAEVTVTITDQDGKDVDVTLEAGKDYTITKQSAAKARMLLATAKPLTDAPTEVGTYHVALTEAGKQKLKDAGYTTVNETPADFTISPADTPTPTPDTKTDDEKYDPIIPGDKVKVDDPTKLTNEEKDEVVKAVEDANKDDNGNSTLPDGTKITVDDNGDVTVTYPDGSEDTIPGDKVVEGKTDADKNEPNVPSEDDKVKVDDPTKLTDGEKEDVVKAVEDANKDKDGNSTLPDGTKITVGDNGDVTVTYPDGSKDTIPGDKVVEGKTDADKTDVTVPGTKVEVGDPTKLTDGEKGQVEEAIKDANPNLPDGTKITVADDGTATILYPDGSYKVIDGQDLVTKPGQTTADQVTPVVPGDKVTVVDPNHLTDAEKDQVKTNVEKANQNNFPAGTVVTVADDGTATITYPDGSVDQISAADLITKPTAAGQAGKGTGTTTTNGQGAPAGQGKADQAKTLPQTGNEQGSLLAASGLGMLLLGMLGLGGKRKKED
ncbi:MBG domain-containing protein [Limosilactobacillus oris]|uniref:MBG domain-containing protein n=1 Tax=Limosilactobacillus oris TaxID=1632 RepID=UPI0024B350B2|nr:MBG domain-containing protein [Limosilactobacillus oris]WHO85429.1 MBG domain-containing protein [Limosilactobacillus oris]